SVQNLSKRNPKPNHICQLQDAPPAAMQPGVCVSSQVLLFLSFNRHATGRSVKCKHRLRENFLRAVASARISRNNFSLRRPTGCPRSLAAFWISLPGNAKKCSKGAAHDATKRSYRAMNRTKTGIKT